MRPIIRLVSLPLLAALLFTGAAPAVRAQQAARSPFTGKFAGPFKTEIAGGGYQVGYITITVFPDGKSVSQVTNYTSGITAVGNAVITNGGTSTGTLVCDNGQRFTSKGTFTIDKNGNLCGTASQYGPSGLVASSTVVLPPG